ncbi:L,D-transpeptidase family protein [Marinobacter daepoensis]|uniref:L,D-transpeptidase family protein n=1 Tax=Marinobacter daepoensis TaxID=262077 RepID=UPI0004056812|nr:L,D-transpeptidase family protein [Marinobacter daepoensis]MBY6032724.1 L,D-transpeptidase family protein [Marinobacter daepoensis]
MIVRVLLTITLSLIAISAPASELLARAETRLLPEPTEPGVKDELLEITQVLVNKGERRLYLLSGEHTVRHYRISLGDNPVGHKLYEGDERTPEGDYVLDWRNASSDFYKSIHISYPSPRDRELAEAWGLNPGGSIMIHGLPNNAGDMAFAYTGLDWTDGCIAVTNEAMDEIWQLVQNGTPIRIEP